MQVTEMDRLELLSKCLNLAEGRESPESWWDWWHKHESEIENLLNYGEFLKLKPRAHGFSWVPVLGSQKEAIAILEKNGIAFEASDLYQKQYLDELNAYCKKQKQAQQERQKKFRTQHPEWFARYPKFSKILAKVLDSSDEVQSAATAERIMETEKRLEFTLPTQVREFFFLTGGVNISADLSIDLSRLFTLTIHEELYCVLGEFWKEADGDLLLLRSGEEIIWYYAHEQDKVKFLQNTMYELLEKEFVHYLQKR